MIERSNELALAVEKYSQYVTPKVVARFGDNRFLENIQAQSSNQSYDKAIESYKPNLYWKFYDNLYTASDEFNNIRVVSDSSGGNNHGTVQGSEGLVFPVGVQPPEMDPENPVAYTQSIFGSGIFAYNDFPFSNASEMKSPPVDDSFLRVSDFDLSSSFDFTYSNFPLETDKQSPYLTSVNLNKWTIVNRKFKIENNTADVLDKYITVSNLPKRLDHALVETGGADGTIVAQLGASPTRLSNGQPLGPSSQFDYAPRDGQGVIIRYKDDDNYIVVFLTSQRQILKIIEYVDGKPAPLTGTAQWSFSGLPIQQMTTSQRLKIVFVGNVLKVYIIRNGVDNFVGVAISATNLQNIGTSHGVAAVLDAARTSAPRWGYLSLETSQSADYSFSGDGAKISADNLNFTFNNKMTLGMAIKFPNFSGQKYFAGFRSSSNFILSFAIENSTLKIFLKGQASESASVVDYLISYTPQTPFTPNNWINIFLTINNNIVTLFVNGQPVGSISDYLDSVLLATINSIEALSYSYNASIDDFFILPEALTESEALRVHKLGSSSASFFDGQSIFNEMQIFNTIEEETFPYISLDGVDELGGSLVVNGEFYLIGDRVEPDDKYFFLSRQKSSSVQSSGEYLFEDDPYIFASFNKIRVNRFTFATGSMLSKIARFTLLYHRYGDPKNEFQELFSDQFEKLDSKFDLHLDNTEIIDEIRIIIHSTISPSSRALIHQLNLYYEEDISDDVISFDFSKVRDNYEATLPVGSTAANNGLLVLNNIHKKYNRCNAESPYYGYIEPETKISIGLTYEIAENVYETIPLGESLFVDSWNISSDAMTAEAAISDWSVILQELTADNGFVFEDIVAGRAARDVVRAAGFPSEKIKYYDSYQRTVLRDRPVAFFRLNDVGGEGGIVDEWAGISGEVVGSPSNIQFRSTPVVEQEKDFEIINESRSLASLYNITAESVGLESAKTRAPNYSVFVDSLVANDSNGSIDPNPYLIVSSNNSGKLSFVNDFSIELCMKPTFIEEGDERSLIAKKDSTNNNYHIYTKKLNNKYIIGASVKTSNGDYNVEHEFDNGLNINYHIVLVKTSNQIKLFVNNVLKATSLLGSVNSFSSSILFFKESSTSLSFNGYLSNVSFYDKALKDYQVNEHYETFSLKRLYVFPYLYFFDSTYWDGLLEFATADVGMFYFNEYNDFIYEYKNAFHEEVIKNHSEVQHYFNYDKNIINSTYISDIQANKIEVEVSPKSKINTAVQSLWRAESGESLAITKLEENISITSNSVRVSNTENPIWPRSGYIKINNEIIKYNNRSINTFTELERGQFETIPAAHNSQTICREVRVYDFTFSEKPAVSIRYPFVIAQIFEGRVDVDKFESTPFGGKVVVSASTSAQNQPSSKSDTSNLVFLEGRNPLTEKEYFFSIAGVSIAEKTSEERVKSESRSFGKKTLRPKQMLIQNRFIQSSAYAKEVADFLITYFGDPVPIIDVDAIGIPFLQLGDLVEIDKMPDLDIDKKLFWIIETSITYDGGVSQSFKLRSKQ
jgi:hypothetical protein